MLVHHSGVAYDVAASEAATVARTKLEARIEEGRSSGKRIIEKVMTEVPVDMIAPSASFSFDGDIEMRSYKGVTMTARNGAGDKTLTIHKHAMGQICERSEFHYKYAQFLQEKKEWGHKLLAHNLNELYSHIDKKFLMRSYDNQLRGFLSDKYRRLDSRPLLEAFAGSCQELGALPIEGYGSDTKVMLKAVLPMVFEPVAHEVLAFGIAWENSDYGNGKHQLSGFIDRLWCTNYAIMTEEFAQVHLGKRLSDDISFSQRTYELDTATQASAIKDIVKQIIAPEAIGGYCDLVKRANEMKIDAPRSLAALKTKLTKAEVEQVAETYNSPEVEMLPPGNTLWRMSNAISFFGSKVEDIERKVELMKIAGSVLEGAKAA